MSLKHRHEEEEHHKEDLRVANDRVSIQLLKPNSIDGDGINNLEGVLSLREHEDGLPGVVGRGALLRREEIAVLAHNDRTGEVGHLKTDLEEHNSDIEVLQLPPERLFLLSFVDCPFKKVVHAHTGVQDGHQISGQI